jgi:glycosyltransferase involved in cell wall biosynthesis
MARDQRASASRIPFLRELYWRAALNEGVTGQDSGKDGRVAPIWHSTYYTSLAGWPGPVVVTVYDLIHERYPGLFAGVMADRFRSMKRRAITTCDAVICISSTTRDDVRRYYGVADTRLRVVPVACSGVFQVLDEIDGQLPTQIEMPFLLYVGSRVHYKGFRDLLTAYARWSPRSEIGLVVVGQAWSADEQRHLASLGLSERVCLLTGVCDRELCALYNRAMAFVYPSLYEGFGIPLLEAMACGCTVVASRIPSTLEVATDKPIYFEPGQPDALRAALDVAAAEGRYSERVSSGLQHVKLYSWTRTAWETLEVYRSLT